MHNLTPITPLGGQSARIDQIGPFTLTEVTEMALASVAARLGKEDAAAKSLSDIIGADAPAPSRMAGGTVSAFWTGPDQWMVEAPLDTHEEGAKHLAQKLAGLASVTEQTDAWCRFDLAGAELARVMELLCSADVATWQGGEVQRNMIEHVSCFVLCRSPDHLSVIGPRSSAGSLHHALETACRAVI